MSKDLSFNKIFKSALKSKCKCYKKFIYWFCKHYFYCDIHPDMNISSHVQFEHNALGTVINKNSVIEENVIIQHHVLIGSTNDGTPYIQKGVYIGAYAIVIGNITIGKNSVIGAGTVVTKDVPDACTVVGNPMRIISKNRL